MHKIKLYNPGSAWNDIYCVKDGAKYFHDHMKVLLHVIFLILKKLECKELEEEHSDRILEWQGSKLNATKLPERFREMYEKTWINEIDN